MSEIPEVRVNSIQTRQIQVMDAPFVRAPEIPISIPIGFPIIEMPCVETRQSSYENDALITNDEAGNVILCPAGVPSYNPMDYTPSEFVYSQPAEPQRHQEPEIPASDVPATKENKDCPPPDAPEIGTKIPDGKGTKEIISYQLIGNRCVTQYSEVSFTEQLIDAIPSVPQVLTTGSIAVVATASAAATPFLLKAVKPLVAKVGKMIRKKLGKKVSSPNLSQKRTNVYREKKGLPPLKLS